MTGTTKPTGRDDLRAAVEAAAGCPHGPGGRHYYALDSTCQRCEMPSWVEALIRAALAAAPSPQPGEGLTEAEQRLYDHLRRVTGGVADLDFALAAARAAGRADADKGAGA